MTTKNTPAKKPDTDNPDAVGFVPDKLKEQLAAGLQAALVAAPANNLTPAVVLLRHIDGLLRGALATYQAAGKTNTNGKQITDLEAALQSVAAAGASSAVLEPLQAQIDGLKAEGGREAGKDMAEAIRTWITTTAVPIPLGNRPTATAAATTGGGEVKTRTRAPNVTQAQKDDDAARLEAYLADLRKDGDGWTSRGDAMTGAGIDAENRLGYARDRLERAGKLEKRGTKRMAEFRLKA